MMDPKEKKFGGNIISQKKWSFVHNFFILFLIFLHLNFKDDVSPDVITCENCYKDILRELFIAHIDELRVDSLDVVSRPYQSFLVPSLTRTHQQHLSKTRKQNVH